MARRNQILKNRIPAHLWLLKKGMNVKVMMKMPECSQPLGKPPDPGGAAVERWPQVAGPFRTATQRFQCLM